jgi:hypothetical protein
MSSSSVLHVFVPAEIEVAVVDVTTGPEMQLPMIANPDKSQNHQKEQRDFHKLPQKDGAVKTKRFGLFANIAYN